MSEQPLQVLLRALEQRGSTGPDLARLPVVCAELVEADGASICLCTHQGTVATWRASDPRVGAAVSEQWSSGQGPGLGAATSGTPVVESDLSASRRWPLFGAELVRQGLRGVIALPLQIEQDRLGALTLYFRSPYRVPGEDLGDLVELAGAVGQLLVLWHAQDPDTLDLLGDAAVVFQAAGVIAAQLGCSADEGLDRLRSHAYGQRRDLLELARHVVDGTVRFDD